MDYAIRHRSSRRPWVGLGAVLLFHLVLVWAVSSGLARKFVKVLKGPVETQLIEDAKPDLPPPPPPPPPPKNLPPPPPPAFVPKAEVDVAAPSAANAIAAVSNAAPVVAPPAPPPPPPPPPPAPPAPQVRVAPVIDAAANCQRPEYPSASRRAEEEGTVVLRFLIGTDGAVVEAQVDKSSGYGRLDEAARAALSRCRFKPGTVDGKPEQSWASLRYTWRLE